MTLMSGNREVRESAEIKPDRLVHLLEDLVRHLRIGAVAKILSLAAASRSHPEGHKDQIARAAGCRPAGSLAPWRKQYLARTVDLTQKTFSNRVSRRGRGGFFHRMVRRKINYWSAAFRPYKIGLKFATITDERGHGGVSPHFLPSVENAAPGDCVEENIVVEGRKTAMEREDRLDVRVIVRGFTLEIRREKPELPGDELLQRV